MVCFAAKVSRGVVQLNTETALGMGDQGLGVLLATFRRKKINESGEFRADFPSATFRVRVRTCSEVAVTNFFREAT